MVVAMQWLHGSVGREIGEGQLTMKPAHIQKWKGAEFLAAISGFPFSQFFTILLQHIQEPSF